MQSLQIQKEEDLLANQQIVARAISVKLVDCTKCEVKIPRAKMHEYWYEISSSTRQNMDQEIAEFREEQEQPSILQNKKHVYYSMEHTSYLDTTI